MEDFNFLILKFFNFSIILAFFIVLFLGSYTTFFGNSILFYLYTVPHLAGLAVAYYALRKTHDIDIAIVFVAFTFYSCMSIKYFMVGTGSYAFFIWMSAPLFASILSTKPSITLLCSAVYLLIALKIFFFPSIPILEHFSDVESHTTYYSNSNLIASISFVILFSLVFTIYRERSKKFIEIAHTDSLTGLTNRLFMEKNIENVKQNRLYDKHVSLTIIYLDLNKFKFINDVYGHSVGDTVLMLMAQRIQAVKKHELLSNNTVVAARFGGDEFVISIDRVFPFSQLKTLLEQLYALLAKPYNVNGILLDASASIGFSTTQISKIDKIIDDAEAAMRQAKKNSDRCFVQFSPKRLVKPTKQTRLINISTIG